MTPARQSGGSTTNLFSSLICEPSWSPEHWDRQQYGVLDLSSHTSLWLPDPWAFTSCLAQVPVVFWLGCPQKLQTRELHSLYSPCKQTCLCHSRCWCINSDKATLVFSARAVHLLRLFRVTKHCSDAFCSLQLVLRREGRGFIRPKEAVGGEPSRCFNSACWVHVLSPRRRASRGAEIVTCSGLNLWQGKWMSPSNWGQHLSCSVYGTPLRGALINMFFPQFRVSASLKPLLQSPSPIL